MVMRDDDKYCSDSLQSLFTVDLTAANPNALAWRSILATADFGLILG